MNSAADENTAQASHLSLVVVQIEVLGVLFLSVPPPPLGRSAPLGPSVAHSSEPLRSRFEKYGCQGRLECREHGFPPTKQEGQIHSYSLVAAGPGGEHVRLQPGKEALLVTALAYLHVQQVGVQGSVVNFCHSHLNGLLCGDHKKHSLP